MPRSAAVPAVPAVPAVVVLVCVLALGACTSVGKAPNPSAPASSKAAGLRSMAAPRQPPLLKDYSQYVSRPLPAESFSTTFGFLLCSLKSEAQITAVRPTRTIGNGFSVVGIRLVTFRLGDGFTLASPGFPPKSRPTERVERAVGATPRTCTDEDVQSEIQIGMRRTSADGGGWHGAIVEYELPGQRLSLEIPFGMLMCGASTDPC